MDMGHVGITEHRVEIRHHHGVSEMGELQCLDLLVIGQPGVLVRHEQRRTRLVALRSGQIAVDAVSFGGEDAFVYFHGMKWVIEVMTGGVVVAGG